MSPTSPLGQLDQSMSQGQPELSQISNTSPAGQPGLQPPAQPPMPEKSPASEILKRAGMRRGINLDNHPQLQPQQLPGQPIQSQQGQPEVPISEVSLILKALTTRLSHHSKITEKLMDSFLPKPPQEAGAEGA